MKHTLAGLVGLIASLHSFAAQSDEVIFQAARSLRPDVLWNKLSIVKADIDCDGKQDFAILGKNKFAVILFVFNHGLSGKPVEYSQSLDPYGDREFKLYAEDLNLQTKTYSICLAQITRITNAPRLAKASICTTVSATEFISTGSSVNMPSPSGLFKTEAP